MRRRPLPIPRSRGHSRKRRVALAHRRFPASRAVCVLSPAAALVEAEGAFNMYSTDKEVAQAVRNAFVKKVRSKLAARRFYY